MKIRIVYSEKSVKITPTEVTYVPIGPVREYDFYTICMLGESEDCSNTDIVRFKPLVLPLLIEDVSRIYEFSEKSAKDRLMPLVYTLVPISDREGLRNKLIPISWFQHRILDATTFKHLLEYEATKTLAQRLFVKDFWDQLFEMFVVQAPTVYSRYIVSPLLAISESIVQHFVERINEKGERKPLCEDKDAVLTWLNIWLRFGAEMSFIINSAKSALKVKETFDKKIDEMLGQCSLPDIRALLEHSVFNNYNKIVEDVVREDIKMLLFIVVLPPLQHILKATSKIIEYVQSECRTFIHPALMPLLNAIYVPIVSILNAFLQTRQPNYKAFLTNYPIAVVIIHDEAETPEPLKWLEEALVKHIVTFFRYLFKDLGIDTRIEISSGEVCRKDSLECRNAAWLKDRSDKNNNEEDKNGKIRVFTAVIRYRRDQFSRVTRAAVTEILKGIINRVTRSMRYSKISYENIAIFIVAGAIPKQFLATLLTTLLKGVGDSSQATRGFKLAYYIYALEHLPYLIYRRGLPEVDSTVFYVYIKKVDKCKGDEYGIDEKLYSEIFGKKQSNVEALNYTEFRRRLQEIRVFVPVFRLR